MKFTPESEGKRGEKEEGGRKRNMCGLRETCSVLRPRKPQTHGFGRGVGVGRSAPREGGRGGKKNRRPSAQVPTPQSRMLLAIGIDPVSTFELSSGYRREKGKEKKTTVEEPRCPA